jgi:hypothetical protein
MKELINDLIRKSGLSNKDFAEAVGTSQSYLCQQKNFQYINYKKLISWAKIFKIESIENDFITIKVKL